MHLLNISEDIPSDLCEIISTDKIPLDSPEYLEEINKHIFKAHLPKLGVDSGNFSKVLYFITFFDESYSSGCPEGRILPLCQLSSA